MWLKQIKEGREAILLEYIIFILAVLDGDIWKIARDIDDPDMYRKDLATNLPNSPIFPHLNTET